MLLRVLLPTLVLIGLLIASGRVPWLAWFGNLPGDLRIVSGDRRIHVPLASMLLVTASLSALLWILRRLN